MGTSPFVPKTPFVPAALIGVKYCRPFKRRSFCVASLRPFKLSRCLPNNISFLNKCKKSNSRTIFPLSSFVNKKVEIENPKFVITDLKIEYQLKKSSVFGDWESSVSK